MASPKREAEKVARAEARAARAEARAARDAERDLAEEKVDQEAVNRLHLQLDVIGAYPMRRYQPIDLASDSVIDRRRVFCKHYELCLDFAEAGCWSSWTCGHCPVEEEVSAEVRRQQAFEISKVYAARRA